MAMCHSFYCLRRTAPPTRMWRAHSRALEEEMMTIAPCYMTKSGGCLYRICLMSPPYRFLRSSAVAAISLRISTVITTRCLTQQRLRTARHLRAVTRHACTPALHFALFLSIHLVMFASSTAARHIRASHLKSAEILHYQWR